MYFYIYIFIMLPTSQMSSEDIQFNGMLQQARFTSGPQHPPSSSQAALRNWRPDWLDALNEVS